MRCVKVPVNTGQHAPDREATDPGEKSQAVPGEKACWEDLRTGSVYQLAQDPKSDLLPSVSPSAKQVQKQNSPDVF